MNIFGKLSKRVLIALLSTALIGGAVSCGGGGGGGDDSSGDGASTIEGTLSFAAGTARVLGPDDGGVAGVQVGALGDSTTTDKNGNFNLSVDSATFAGGKAPVEFSFVAEGIDTRVALSEVLGGPDVTGYVNFVLENSGAIVGESTDANGNVLSSSGASGLGCTTTDDFVDGSGGALWKPQAERTGTVVILMPANFREAGVQVLNNAGAVVDGPLIRDCCEHNGGREHIYLTRSSSSLAGAGTPLTVRFEFSNGVVDCRTVPDPNQRYD